VNSAPLDAITHWDRQPVPGNEPHRGPRHALTRPTLEGSASRPRLIAFNEYASDDHNEVAVVQVRPDAASMEPTWASSVTASDRSVPPNGEEGPE
jgi:hypothetical protein